MRVALDLSLFLSLFLSLLSLSLWQAGRSAGGDKGKGKFSEKDVAMADVD